MGMQFDVIPSGVEEELLALSKGAALCEDPEAMVRELALAKARHVASNLVAFREATEPLDKEAPKGALVIGADTVVILDDEVLGKAEDAASAREMLERLSDRVHEVASGVAVVDAASGMHRVAHDITRVKMRRFSPHLIEGYISTGEPIGKAGAYAIQGLGGLLVERIEGCYFNVVGLPLAKFIDILGQFGIGLCRDGRWGWVSGDRY